MHHKQEQPIRAIVSGTIAQLTNWIETVWAGVEYGYLEDRDGKVWLVTVRRGENDGSPTESCNLDFWGGPDHMRDVWEWSRQHLDASAEDGRLPHELKMMIDQWEEERKQEGFISMTSIGKGVELEVFWEREAAANTFKNLIAEIQRRWEVEILPAPESFLGAAWKVGSEPVPDPGDGVSDVPQAEDGFVRNYIRMRFETIRELDKKGLGLEDMANAVGVSLSQLKRDRRKLRLPKRR